MFIDRVMSGVEISKNAPSQAKILTPEALQFLTRLHKEFGPARLALLKMRQERQHLIDAGTYPQILPDSLAIRQNPDWQVAAPPEDLQCRWVEITGSPDKKTIINALNSGANVFMADFEDATSPAWENIIEGQANLVEAVKKTLSYISREGKEYRLMEKGAALFCRPRGWHLVEKHVKIGGEPLAASLFDFGLYLFHNAKNLLEQKSGPYFYLSKLENHLEARLWNDIFIFAQNALNIPRGTIRATVLIETILAAFEMEEILWELKEHSAGLNAGRWDYIFSIIKKFHHAPILFPDRSAITMQAPFLKAYADLIVRTCHKRRIHAIGGMSAFAPSRIDPNINKIAFTHVHEEKEREAAQGFDGTWVAHPDLVQLARIPFQKRTGLRLNQILFPLTPLVIKPKDLLDFKIPNSHITEAGVRNNINVALRYISAWLAGVGVIKVNHLMEDASTAEIARSLLWQWLHHKAELFNVGVFTREAFATYLKVEINSIQHDKSFPEKFSQYLPQAKQLLERLVLEKNIPEFFTTAAYKELEP